MPHYRRMTDASISEKILDTMFLITIGLGYLFALAHLYYSDQGRDGIPGLSVDDIKITYYGEHQKTRLGAALNGAMGVNLENPGQKQTIADWIGRGGSENEFNSTVAPILNQNCIVCHSSESGMGLPPLTSYNDVKKLTESDHGASIQSLVRVSHIHLFGIAFILFFVGRIFILCEMPVMLKRIAVAVPFFAILLDILSWYATRLIPEFAVVVVLSGALMGISLAIQIFVSLYQMWFYTPKIEPIEM
ncbi:hypothetical protein D8Y20_13065 [Mariprofundus sp. EBB-1]|nr:hypothetical protein D8Y20_13065 [Mariprofundus sp. EBB-1]